MKEKILANLEIAFDAVLANKMRSILTALGIIFGVSAVIAMLAIGKGAEKEILEQIRLVGVNNIIVTPVIEQKEEEIDFSDQSGNEGKYSPGLNLLDVESIKYMLDEVEEVSPEIVIETNLVKGGIRRSAKLVGVEPSYFDLANFTLSEGSMFTSEHLDNGKSVCIIGKGIQKRFFSSENPIGKSIKCGPHWLTIIGVLDERIISESNIANLGIRDFNMDIYTPIKTVLMRYRNRALITTAALKDDGSAVEERKNYHQIDRLTVRVAETEVLNPAADIISRMLKRRHNNVVDFHVTIPELLLKQQQRTKSIFNFVLGAIAGISLLVGGIGIMNIMLASVLERIREIGLRLSIGAKKEDIVFQFLFEAVMISISGGIIGVILGVSMAYMVSWFADIPTVITLSSILLSFGVAATVGLIFGITPARRAASQDPITSLRYD
jgi:putative ABC transport system permease protein